MPSQPDDISVSSHFSYLLEPNVAYGWKGDANFKTVNTFIDGCPAEPGSWTTFLYEHFFDENTGKWTNRWSANSFPIMTATYAIQNFTGHYQLGFSNELGDESPISNTPIRNFWYEEV